MAAAGAAAAAAAAAAVIGRAVSRPQAAGAVSARWLPRRTAAAAAYHQRAGCWPTAGVVPRRPSAHITRTLRGAAPARRAFSAAGKAKEEGEEEEAASTTSTKPIPKPDFLDEAESHIWDLLSEAFAPAELSVRDISGGCGSMYGIEISSAAFRGANMLKQQRMVNAVLGDLMKNWHGVQLKTRVS